MVTPEASAIIGGKYRLERVLGVGGMGSVWAAKHLQLETDVAIKFMAPEFATSNAARTRFEREARLLAQLKSPNVVQVHDSGVESDGSLYLVMELLEGEDLEARLGRLRALSLASAAEIVRQAARALTRAHEVGLVHRDLKPANLFLARQGDEEVVKILDFGIAKEASGSSNTRTGTLMGSPHYMSPEQVRDAKHVDGRSDLWSLGVIAFRMLTGTLPFESEAVGDILVEICSAPIPLASMVAPSLPAAVDRFFERALARDPAARFASARELSDFFATLASQPNAAVDARASVPSTLASPVLQAGGPRAATTPLQVGVAHRVPHQNAFVPTLPSEPDVGAVPIARATPPVQAVPAQPGGGRRDEAAGLTKPSGVGPTDPGVPLASGLGPVTDPMVSLATRPTLPVATARAAPGAVASPLAAAPAPPGARPGKAPWLVVGLVGIAGLGVGGYFAYGRWGAPQASGRPTSSQTHAANASLSPDEVTRAPTAKAQSGDDAPTSPALVAAGDPPPALWGTLPHPVSTTAPTPPPSTPVIIEPAIVSSIPTATPAPTTAPSSTSTPAPTTVPTAPPPVPTSNPTTSPTSQPKQTGFDGCSAAGQSCRCANTGWHGLCGPGPHKNGLYCHCD